MTETRLPDSSSESRNRQDLPNRRSRNGSGKRPAPQRATGQLLSIAEVTRRFGINEYRLYQWADEGKVHVLQVGGRFKYLDFEIAAILRLLFDTLGAAA